jgi:pimeloyl-ACP methyl ester carboxylesterase
VQGFVRRLIEKQHKDAIIGGLKAMAEREDATQYLSSFKFPVVLVHGDSDALIPVDRAREIKVVLPIAHLVELPGIGHMPMMEAPERTAEALKLLK